MARGLRAGLSAQREEARLTWATVVNIHHGEPYDVYCGRPGKGRDGPWGNPIEIGKPCLVCELVHGREPALLDCYARWLRDRMTDERAAEVRSLHGKVLGCFCVKPNGTGLCHALVLAQMAAELSGAVWYRVGLGTTNCRRTAADWARSRVGSNVVEVLDTERHVRAVWRVENNRWYRGREPRQVALDLETETTDPRSKAGDGSPASVS
jgi:hypothetical protein